MLKKSKILIAALCLTLNLASCSEAKKAGESQTFGESGAISDGRSDSENTEETVIHFAAANNSDYINKAIKQFNEADNGYRIEVAEYDHTLDDNDNSLNLIDFDLTQKIINTNDIDLVISWAFAEESNYRILRQKGAFADMYKFMENDAEINTDTLNSHVLQLNEINGELCAIPTYYVAHTMIGSAEYVGTKTDWTIDEMIERWEQMPDNATINRARTKETVYYNLLRDNLEFYVDYENGTVNFDSDDFRKNLEFCNSFDYNNREKTDYDLNAPDFCDSANIFSFANRISEDGSEKTFVGYPTPNGSGAYLRSFNESFSICASSDEKKQKGAWEFIRTFFTEEWQEENALSYSDRSKGYASQNAFCMNNQANENIKNNIINKKYSPSTFESKGETYETYFPTLEECNTLEEYLNGIDRWGVNIDDEISNIVEEEAFAYFADEISIDECIDRIQNRASIWISEKS